MISGALLASPADVAPYKQPEFHREIEEKIHKYVNGHRWYRNKEPLLHSDFLREEARSRPAWYTMEHISSQSFDTESPDEIAKQTVLGWVMDDGHSDLISDPELTYHGVGVEWAGYLKIVDVLQ